MGDLPTEHHDGFLTKKVQKFLYPDGAVYKVVATTGDGVQHENWILSHSQGKTLGLGPSFKAARESVNGLIRAQRAKEFMEKHATDYPK